MRRSFGLALCAVALSLSSCVDGSVNNAATKPAELARYLPEKTRFIQAVDVARAREELGLPEDANAAPTNNKLGRPNSPQSRLFEVTSNAFPTVSEAYLTEFKARGSSPLDGTLIRAAADGEGLDAGRMTIVSTAEAFEDVAAKLELTGYDRNGSIYVAGKRTPETAATIVADAGDGRVVFADERAAANEVLDRFAEDADPGPVAEALQAVNGTVRLAVAAERGSASCVTEFAASQSSPGTRAIVALEIEGEKPDPERFNPRVFTGLETGTPSVLVDALIVPFSVRRPPKENPRDPIFQLLSESSGAQTFEVGKPGRTSPTPLLPSPPFRSYDCP